MGVDFEKLNTDLEKKFPIRNKKTNLEKLDYEVYYSDNKLRKIGFKLIKKEVCEAIIIDRPKNPIKWNLAPERFFAYALALDHWEEKIKRGMK